MAFSARFLYMTCIFIHFIQQELHICPPATDSQGVYPVFFDTFTIFVSTSHRHSTVILSMKYAKGKRS